MASPVLHAAADSPKQVPASSPHMAASAAAAAELAAAAAAAVATPELPPVLVAAAVEPLKLVLPLILGREETPCSQ